MASESDAWWSQQYAVYSIHDLQTLPIFNKFVSMHYPFERANSLHSESFKSESAVDKFQWADNEREEGEIFSHDRSNDTWFYEHRYRDAETLTTIRSWWSPEAEWGEIIRQYRDYAVHENWKLQGEQKHYERYSLQSGEKRGIKTSILPALDGTERWTETYWDREGETEFEKVYVKPDATGGEIKHTKGDLWWGEVWHKADDHTEMKRWHTQGEHDWGHTTGEACGKIWNEKWDINKSKRNEERLVEDGDRRRGFRYVRDGADWYRQEWDGLKVLDIKEGEETLQKQQFLQEIDQASVGGHDGLLKGEHTIDLLLREAKHFAGEVADIKKERLDIPKPNSNDVDSLFKAMRLERDLADKQERLKQRMIDDLHADHGKYYQLYILFERLLKESHSTIKEIALALDRNKIVQDDEKKWAALVQEMPQRPNYASYDKSVLYIDSLIEMEKLKQLHIDKLKGGIERAEVEKAMDTLYQIMVKHDAVSDKIVELVADNELKAKLDGFQDQFEEIHAHYIENADPDKLHENLQLLLDYQPIHLHLVGRLRGYDKAEISDELVGIKGAVDDTKGKMSLKTARAKVRSGRAPKDTPFQLVDRSLNKLIPFMFLIDKTIRGHLPDTHPALVSSLHEAQQKSVDTGEPFDIIITKAALLSEAAVLLDPQANTHEAQLLQQDQDLNKLLENSYLALRHDKPEDAEKSKALIERKYEHEDVGLLNEKVAAASYVTREVDELILKIENLMLELEDLERIIEEKSEEITELTTVLDIRDQKVHILGLELYERQKYQQMFDEKDKECELLKLKLKEKNLEIESLRQRLDELSRENEALKALLRELEKFKLNALNSEEENKRLQIIITQYEVTTRESRLEFEVTILRVKSEIERNQSLYDEKVEECRQLLETKRAYEELLLEAAQLRDNMKDLNVFKVSALDYKNENERLKETIKSFETMLGERSTQYEEKYKNLNSKLTEMESSLKSKDQDNDNLLQQIKNLVAARRRQLLLRVHMKFFSTLKMERASTFFTWKFRAEIPPDSTEKIMQQIPEVRSTVPEEEEEWSETQVVEYKAAEDPNLKIRKDWLRENPVFYHMIKEEVRFRDPMPLVSFYLLIEEMMEKKVMSDNTDLESGRRPPHFAPYALEYLLKTHGVKRVVQREFARMIPFLYHQIYARVPLAILIARLMHMFHSNPAPLEASILVMRYNLQFKTIADKYTLSREERKLAPRSEAERVITGGEAQLCDILSEFYDQFAEERVYLWHFLRHIKPAWLTTGDYVFAVISWFARVKRHQEDEAIWEILSSGREAGISTSEFVQAVNTRLGLGLSSKILKEAHTELAPSGYLTKETVDRKIRPSRTRPPEEFLVTKAAFLTAILEAYNAWLRRISLSLRNQFQTTGQESIDQTVLSRLAKEHDSSLSDEFLEKLHEGGVKWSTGPPVDVVGYPGVMLLHPVGALSKPPLQVPELSHLTDPHVYEYDLISGVKVMFTRVITKTTTTRTTRSGSARRVRLDPS